MSGPRGSARPVPSGASLPGALATHPGNLVVRPWAGAGGGTRTPKTIRPHDFESRASASSATPARPEGARSQAPGRVAGARGRIERSGVELFGALKGQLIGPAHEAQGREYQRRDAERGSHRKARAEARAAPGFGVEL